MLNWILALLTAALLILAVPGWSIVWFAPIALAPLLLAVTFEERPLRRFLLGWGAGVAYWFGVCYWIQFVLAVHSGVGNAIGWVLLVLFCLAKAIHLGVFAALAGILMQRWWAAPGVAALWVGIEVTHGYLGFQWLALGNAGIDMSVPLRVAPFTGVYGISFLFALTAVVLALAVLRRPRAELAWVILVPMAALLPAIPNAGNGTSAALLAQPNISQTEDWTQGTLDRTLRRQVAASLQAALEQTERPPELIVWPEVPAPFYYDRDENFREYVNGLARMTRAHVLVGVVAHTADGAPLNSAQLITPQGRPVTRYDKVNLVPFGEFVPWPFGFAENISSEVGDFRPGRQVVVSPVGEHRLSTFICYESVFPNFVRRFVDRGAGVLVNISNDGWFGKTAARVQHLSIVRMRAVENRRWILRSTNDGLTTTIDSAGRVRGMLAPYQEGISYAAFNYLTEKTVYTRWGDWFAVVCATVALLCLVADRVV